MLESFFNFLNELVKSFLTLLKILVRSKFFLPTHSTSTDSCFILGNGPSLKLVLKEHANALKTHTLICVNKFPDTDFFEILQPRYFLFTSTGYYKPEKIKHEHETRVSILNALVEKTTWPLTLFCPIHAKSNPDFINKIKSNTNIEICFFNSTPVEGLKKINHIFMHLNWGCPRPHNVLIPSILMAINSGIKNIYLVGADHSWLPLISVNENNMALLNNQHFYDADTSQKGSMYRDSKPRRLHEILDKFKLTFEGYFVLKDYADSKNVKIYNCNPYSFIDAFERKKLEDII